MALERETALALLQQCSRREIRHILKVNEAPRARVHTARDEYRLRALTRGIWSTGSLGKRGTEDESDSESSRRSDRFALAQRQD